MLYLTNISHLPTSKIPSEEVITFCFQWIVSRIFKILCHATLDPVEILCTMLFLFKQATGLVGFKPKILTSLVVSMSVLFHCPSVLFRLVPGTQEAVYPVV